MSDLVGNSEDRFSHNEANIKVRFEGGSKVHKPNRTIIENSCTTIKADQGLFYTAY